MMIHSISLAEPQRHLLRLHKPKSQQTYCYVYWEHQLPSVATALTIDAMRPDTDLTLWDVATAFSFLAQTHKDAKWPKESPFPPSQSQQPSEPPENWWNQ